MTQSKPDPEDCGLVASELEWFSSRVPLKACMRDQQGFDSKDGWKGVLRHTLRVGGERSFWIRVPRLTVGVGDSGSRMRIRCWDLGLWAG